MEINLFKYKDESRDISISATLDDQKLVIEDHSLDPALEKINGRPELEIQLTVKEDELQKLVLHLVKERFQGNSTITNMETWLKEKNINYSKNSY